MRQQDKEITGQQVETQNVASDDLDRNREYHYETIDKCWHCNGTGKVAETGTGVLRRFAGKTAKEKTCSFCNGSGRVRKKKTVVISLEPYFEN